MFIYLCHTDAGTFVLEPQFRRDVDWHLSLDGRYLASFPTASQAARSIGESGVAGVSNSALLPPPDLTAWVMRWCAPRRQTHAISGRD
jgi:hypothetical protein